MDTVTSSDIRNLAQLSMETDLTINEVLEYYFIMTRFRSAFHFLQGSITLSDYRGDRFNTSKLWNSILERTPYYGESFLNATITECF